jgi:hypothetical protein
MGSRDQVDVHSYATGRDVYSSPFIFAYDVPRMPKHDASTIITAANAFDIVRTSETPGRLCQGRAPLIGIERQE